VFKLKRTFKQTAIIAFLAMFSFSFAAPAVVHAATYSSTVYHSQQIMKKFALPAGPVDGYFGAQTARGLCAFRHMAGQPVNRNNVDTTLYNLLKSYDAKYTSLQKIPARTLDGKTTYLLAHKHCQVMFYVENGFYKRVMPISTAKSGYNTPNGAYWLQGTQRGWSCSTLYPESCTYQSTGRFAYLSNYGNMYNKRTFSGAYKVHGSTSVPTYPASAGCIRVTVGDSDWMYDYVGNNGWTYLSIVGAY
jgi:lipoprotein-anchoring transpeptidase ErfK/SrfK